MKISLTPLKVKSFVTTPPELWDWPIKHDADGIELDKQTNWVIDDFTNPVTRNTCNVVYAAVPVPKYKPYNIYGNGRAPSDDLACQGHRGSDNCLV